MSETVRERRTHEPVPAETLQADAARILDILEEGGVAIIPLDVAYGILAARESGMKRIFDAKNRSYGKPSGMFADWRLSAGIHILDTDRHGMIRDMAETGGLPFSVVAPYRDDHPLIRAVDPFVFGASTKDGTLDMLLNAGQLHDELARQSAARGMLVFGSSANLSLTGSKYRLEDIDAPVRQAADLALDYGLSKYANPEGRSSTIIDFTDFTVIRIGVEFDRLKGQFQKRYGVDLVITEETAGKS